MAFDGWYPLDSFSPGDGDRDRPEAFIEKVRLPEAFRNEGFEREEPWMNASPNVWHRDGVPWNKAPLVFFFTWWLHRHKTQTVGLAYDWVERCRCGAIRFELHRTWVEERRGLRRTTGRLWWRFCVDRTKSFLSR